MDHRIWMLTVADPRYERVMDSLRHDDYLLRRMSDDWAPLIEADDKTWWVAVIRRHGGLAAAAWCATVPGLRDGAVVTDACGDYDRPGFQRLALYPATVRARHAAIRLLPG